MVNLDISDFAPLNLEVYVLNHILAKLPSVKLWFHNADWRNFTWGDCSYSIITTRCLLDELDEESPDDVNSDQWAAFRKILGDLGPNGLLDLEN